MTDLSIEQCVAIEKFKEGHNLFISGPAGSGKSFIINLLYKQAKINRKNIQICAPTGCSSLLLKDIGAKTIHSFAGIGLATEENEVIVNKVYSTYNKRKDWKSLDVLIIDECSMISVKIFELIDAISKRCRNNDKPFGKIQIVLVGDYFQLCPIETQGQPETGKFCFESPLWDETFKTNNHIILKTIFRQKDMVFQTILEEVRLNKMSDETIDILNSRVGQIPDSHIPICKIFPVNNLVEKENKKKFNELLTEKKVYTMTSILDYPELMKTIDSTESQINSEVSRLKQNSLLKEILELRAEATVMCVTNMPDFGICNGSLGKIVSIENNTIIVNFGPDVGHIHISKHRNESESIKGVFIQQFPLILGYASTIHKIQGQTIDNIELDIGSSVFTPAQSYVGISRAKTLDGLYLKSFNPTKVKTNPKAIEFYNNLN